MKVFDPYNHGRWIDNFEESSFEDADIVVLPGGSDWNPALYGHAPLPTTFVSPEQDHEEMALIDAAVEAGKFLVGICKGAQGLTIKAGGWLIQDVSNHEGHHEIQTYDGKTFLVNSSHHQMCYPYDLIPDEEYQILGAACELSPKHIIQGNKDLGTVGFPNIAMGGAGPWFMEPEVVWYPKIRGLAIQPHPEWSSSPASFNQWLNDEIRTSLAICLNTK